jgi:hypothetical protein
VVRTRRPRRAGSTPAPANATVTAQPGAANPRAGPSGSHPPATPNGPSKPATDGTATGASPGVGRHQPAKRHHHSTTLRTTACVSGSHPSVTPSGSLSEPATRHPSAPPANTHPAYHRTDVLPDGAHVLIIDHPTTPPAHAADNGTRQTAPGNAPAIGTHKRHPRPAIAKRRSQDTTAASVTTRRCVPTVDRSATTRHLPAEPPPIPATTPTQQPLPPPRAQSPHVTNVPAAPSRPLENGNNGNRGTPAVPDRLRARQATMRVSASAAPWGDHLCDLRSCLSSRHHATREED